MKNNRLFTLLMVVALLAIVALTAREAIATTAVVSEMDSATHSYISWGPALKAANKEGFMVPVIHDGVAVDSVTQPSIYWAEACGVDLSYANNKELDSATRSYISWGMAIQCR